MISGLEMEAKPTPVGGVAENGSLATTISSASGIIVTGIPGMVNLVLSREEEKVPAGSAGTLWSHRHPKARNAASKQGYPTALLPE